MRMSVVMCTRNRPDLIGRAVDSVLANDHPDFELIVIDQSSTAATREALAQAIAAHPNLTYVHTTRVGLSAAYNAGIARAAGELLAFTDDDCVAPMDWLRTIEQAFAEAPDADLLYGQVLHPSGLEEAGGVLPTLPITRTRRISKRHGFMIYGMGANYAARASLFRTIGGFDEVLGGGGPLRSSQDFDLQYRVYKAGLVTLLAPNVVVDHYGLRSMEDWPQTLSAYGVGDGGFYMKHVRCGDLFATWLLANRVARQAVAAVIKPVLHQHHSSAYLKGVLRGARDSFRFSIDHRRRIYVAR